MRVGGISSLVAVALLALTVGAGPPNVNVNVVSAYGTRIIYDVKPEPPKVGDIVTVRVTVIGFKEGRTLAETKATEKPAWKSTAVLD